MGAGAEGAVTEAARAEGAGAAGVGAGAGGAGAEGAGAAGVGAESAGVAEAAVERDVVEDLEGRYVVPGFVDMHVHGGAGASYQSGRPDEARRVAEYHLGCGTTTTIASLVTDSPTALLDGVAGLADIADEGLVAGIHLEGPYLALGRCGAHDPALLREPDRDEFARLVEVGRGHVRMVTLAPELPGALELVQDAVQAGVIAAVGHTDATGACVREAIEAGARVATHLFNGMRPLHHREGGPVGAALGDQRVVVELINDGVHVEPAVARLVFAAAPDRVALITDAMGAAGMGDGSYRLGVMTVTVSGGRATLEDGTSIAGSTITMADAFRRTIDVVGVSLEDTSRAASLTPARALGLDREVGSLEPGKRADLVVLGDGWSVDRVMKDGRWR
ncbi:N-acetylglucosamine-6-phosphate deacetylase [Actinomadura logoneensis]|uniref:N-acetylglucosamine-6-phosphate deacetylase n=1 Tax=Actinomadura logoneensis TaxID=2293572 RepID=A0A372JU87_9ACTN|nr:N-acetylglucosamine-6-phosphate deacetylase [Actinomadura logoneensis]RFU43519.1 N-acetylglucosamine-6-phosphate deacetylase [Actinomadura logoneensis]